MSESNDPRPAQVRHLLEQGYEARYQGNPEISHQYFWDAQRLAEASQDGSSLGDAWLVLADNALHYCPDDAECSPLELRIEYCERALKYYRDCRDRLGISKGLRMLAVAGEPELQDERLAESLQIAREFNCHRGIAATLDRMGNLALLRGNQAEGVELAQQALHHATLCGDDDALAGAHMTLAFALEACADMLPHLEQYVEISRRRGWTSNELRGLIHCSALGCEPDDLERREKYLFDALPLARNPGEECNHGIILRSFADIARRRGQEREAAALEKQANDVSPELEIPPRFIEAIEKRDPRQAATAIFQTWSSDRD